MSYHEVGHALVTALQQERRAGTEDHDCAANHGCAWIYVMQVPEEEKYLHDARKSLMAKIVHSSWQAVRQRRLCSIQ